MTKAGIDDSSSESSAFFPLISPLLLPLHSLWSIVVALDSGFLSELRLLSLLDFSSTVLLDIFEVLLDSNQILKMLVACRLQSNQNGDLEYSLFWCQSTWQQHHQGINGRMCQSVCIFSTDKMRTHSSDPFTEAADVRQTFSATKVICPLSSKWSSISRWMAFESWTGFQEWSWTRRHQWSLDLLIRATSVSSYQRSSCQTFI